MIPQATVEQILDTAQIVDVVGDFVSLKKRGASYIACCPFHNEKTPSFIVTPSKGIYKCFGCGKSGTAVGFVMEHESMTYPEALRWLAKRYNIEVKEKEETAEEIAEKQHRESLYLVSEFALKFFTESLSADGGVGYQYLRSRGLEDDTIRRFGLGWSPTDRKALLTAARKEGYKDEYLVEAGLCVRRDDGSMYDRFAERVVFPIYTASGRVIAFSARTLRTDKSVAKYVNSPETPIYEKNKSLYGISLAKEAISKRGKCILVEGNVDVVSMHQLGICNVVASCGTGITANQIDFIHRYTDNVTVLYDADAAGVHGTLNAIKLALAAGMKVKAVLLPEGEDPDSYSRKNGREEFEEYINFNEKDFLEYIYDMVLGDGATDPVKRADVISQVCDLLAVIPDPIMRQTYVEAAARRFDFEDSLISRRVRETRDKNIIEEKKRRDRAEEKAERENMAARGSALGQEGRSYSQEGGPYGQEGGAYGQEGKSSGQEGRSLTRRAVAPMPFASELDDPTLAACELSLLDFVLNNGQDELLFDRDSEFYSSSGTCMVAEFIDNCLADDGMDFVNGIYRKAYEAYFELYEKGLDQQKIQIRLLNSTDTQIAAVARELLIDKYELTVKNYSNSLTKTPTMLVLNVPRTLMTYQSRRVAAEIASLTAQLSSPDVGDGTDILTEISRLTAIRVKINNKLGHV